MRCHQYVGLTKEADEFLAAHVERIPDVVCPKCKEVISTKPHILSVVKEDAFYGDGPNLRTYVLKDKRLAKEVVQVQPWSSGPMSFICLEIDEKRWFEWKADESIRGQEVDYKRGLFWV
jgi:hypothetical protein